MKKGFKKFLMVVAVLFAMIPCVFAFSGCSFSVAEQFADEMGYESVEELMDALKGKDGKDGKDGEDGKDATGLDPWDMYVAAIDNDEFEGTYIEFCKQFVNTEVDSSMAIANECLLSVVKVHPYMSKNGLTGQLTDFAGSVGSGVFVSVDGNGSAYVLTNYHVAFNSNRCAPYYELYMYQDNDPIIAEFVGGAATYDLALLKVTNSDILKDSNAKAVKFSTGDVRVGTGTIAIGNTEGEGIAVTNGTVSVDSENIELDVKGAHTYRVMRHETFISHGNSGGALFNLNGELIGITNAGDDTFEHWNYAIPSTLAYRVYQNILANNGDVKVFALGISTQSIDTLVKYNTSTGMVDIVDTLRVANVQAGGSVANVGGLYQGSILKSIEINGVEHVLTRNFHPSELMLDIRVGDEIVLHATYGGTPLEISLTATANYFSVKA